MLHLCREPLHPARPPQPHAPSWDPGQEPPPALGWAPPTAAPSSLGGKRGGKKPCGASRLQHPLLRNEGLQQPWPARRCLCSSRGQASPEPWPSVTTATGTQNQGSCCRDPPAFAEPLPGTLHAPGKGLLCFLQEGCAALQCALGSKHWDPAPGSQSQGSILWDQVPGIQPPLHDWAGENKPTACPCLCPGKGPRWCPCGGVVAHQLCPSLVVAILGAGPSSRVFSSFKTPGTARAEPVKHRGWESAER